MKRTAAVCALALGVTACGDGNPFTTVTTPVAQTPDTTTTEVPSAILNDLERISFDASNNTLTVTGLTQDGVPLVNEYRHVATSFVDGFETFTGQNDPIGRHATAFVASREGGLQAGVVMTGGQFNRFFGGSFFERTGAYEAPVAPDAAFDVTYVGNYAGGLNLPGPLTDRFPVAPGVDVDVDLPQQTAYVRGLMFVNVDLNDMSIEGEIYNRTGVFGMDPATGQIAENSTTPGFLGLPDLVLIDGSIDNDGGFTGMLEVDGDVGNAVGEFAGVIGGPGGNAIVGGTTVAEYTDLLENEIEYGVFVLDQCQVTDTDPICVNSFQP
ncbi:hypothetical protein [uncultured Tateyamaria sp.]|uniref:hypothetical protein n=1 Tax=uncultured Tateyamaria sp. TaxID=455651 RepID=UPI002613B6AF|nr:hypothetical protein [uncultured Tateyamaria sp.]